MSSGSPCAVAVAATTSDASHAIAESQCREIRVLLGAAHPERSEPRADVPLSPGTIGEDVPGDEGSELLTAASRSRRSTGRCH